MTDYLSLTETTHPDFKENDIVTAHNISYVVDYVAQDDDGKIYLCVFNADTQDLAIAVEDAVLGGTLVPMEVLDLTKIPNGIEIINLKQTERLIPAGWAVFVKHRNQYIGWGLESRAKAIAFAVAHQMGQHHISSQF